METVERSDGDFFKVEDVEPILNRAQQLKAEISTLLENYPKDSWKYDSDRINSLLVDLRRLLAA
jgi:hypothetical protein